MAESFRRILEKWPALEAWYEARVQQSVREKPNKPPPVFLLANDQETMTQVLSVITSITTVKRLCQAEKCNQVEVLLGLYMARLHSLDSQRPLKHYLSTRDEPRWIHPHEMTQTALTVQRRLREALDKRFFKRYFDRAEMRQCAYVFEMQARLHPTYKRPEASLNRLIRLCTRANGGSVMVAQQNVQMINEMVTQKLREEMLKVSTTSVELVPSEELQPDQFSSELAETFAPLAPQPSLENRTRDRAQEELQRWMNDPSDVRRTGKVKESVLDYWSRMEQEGEYRLLPKVAKIVFAVPSSSCQIERDFGVAGMMVTTQRASLSEYTIDMGTFLNRNRAFVDPEQCPEIPKAELHRHIPTHTIVPFDMSLFDDDGGSGHEDVDGMIMDLFSQASIEDP